MKKWNLTSEERVFKTPRMEAVKVHYETDSGEGFTHTIIRSNPSVAIIVRREEDGAIAFIRQMRSTTRKQIDEEIIWLSEEEVFARLRNQMTNGEPFFKDLYLSGHTVYALLSYQFLK